MSFAKSHNIGALLSVLLAADNTSLTAGGAGDNTLVTGLTIDRTLFGMPLSMSLGLLCKAVLGAAATLTLKNVQLFHGDAANMSDEAALFSPADVVIFTDAGAGSTLRGQKQYDFDLAGAKRFIRVKFQPDLSAANTDTATVAAAIVLGGKDTI